MNKTIKGKLSTRKVRKNKSLSQWLVYDPTSEQTVSKKSKYRLPKKYKYKGNKKTIELYEQEKKSLDRLQKEIQIRNLNSSNLDIKKEGDI